MSLNTNWALSIKVTFLRNPLFYLVQAGDEPPPEISTSSECDTRMALAASISFSASSVEPPQINKLSICCDFNFDAVFFCSISSAFRTDGAYDLPRS